MFAILKLTRWQEFLPWTIPLTLLGGLMAYRFGGAELDYRLIVVLLANSCIMAYAFMINDIEDSDDDKHDPVRAARNPISSNELSKSSGWIAAIVIGLIGTLLFATIGTNTLIVGIIMWILAHLYSWKPVRLKARPIFDILSHVLMLSALLFITAHFAYTQEMALEAWLLLIAVTLISGYGQFYNQVRDYEADRAAGLHNTASFIGKPATTLVSYLSVGIAILCIAIVILRGAFPIELLGVIAITAPILWLTSSDKDARGDVATDISGKVQVNVLRGVNIVLLAWVAYILIS